MAKKTRFIDFKRKDAIIQRYKALGVPFDMHCTNASVIIEDEKTRYLVGNALSMKGLNFVSRVKRNASKIDKPPSKARPENISYQQFGKIKPGRWENVLEIDLNKAYWHVAYKQGYISREHYLEGLKVDKMERLIALGSLATYKTTYQWPGHGSFKKVREKVNKLTRSWFFHVAYIIDRDMGDTFKKCGCFFYWVDAFFLPSKKESAVRSRLDRLGYEYSIERLQYMEIDETSRGKYIITVKDEKGKTKTYPYSTENKGVRALRSAERVINASQWKGNDVL